MKIILVTSFKGGVGKSTISNNLGDKLKNSIIFNLDFYQDAEDINTSNTINIGGEEDLIPYINKYSDKDYIIIDAGGFDDKRIYKLDIDMFIFPLKSGYRSVKSTIDSVKIIYDTYTRETNTIFIINEYKDEKEFKDTALLMNDIVEESDLFFNGEVKVMGVKYSKALRTVENTKNSISGIRKLGGILGYSFKNVDNNFVELSNEIQTILK